MTGMGVGGGMTGTTSGVVDDSEGGLAVGMGVD
jgi:hypothetical protein